MSANQRTNQAFGAAQMFSERPAPRPGLFEVIKRRLTSTQSFQINTRDTRCSRIDIDVMSGTLHGWWSSTHGGSELPDFQMVSGDHRTYEFHPRPVELTLYAGAGETLLVSVLLTDPIGAHNRTDVCDCKRGNDGDS